MELVKLSYLGNEYTKTEFDYSETIKDLIKRSGSARWFDNKVDKYWYIRRSDTLKLINILKSEHISIRVDQNIQNEYMLSPRGKTREEIELRRIKKQNDPSYAINTDYDASYLNLREGWKLYNYQRAGLEYAINKDGRILLGDDMGLGKTPQGIAIARHYQKEWPLLVIAPSSLVYSWRSEILNWLPDITRKEIKVIKKGKEKPKGMITIASYDYATKQKDAINNYFGAKGVLLIDEAHNMKNPEAKRTKALLNICHSVKRLVIITGTPFLSRPKESWALLNAIDPLEEEWEDQTKFEAKFCEGKVIKIGKKRVYSANGAAKHEYFHDLIREKVMIRRLKTDGGVLDELPEKRRVTQYIEIDGNARENLDLMTKEISFNVLKAYKKNNGVIRDVKKSILAESSVDDKDDIFKAYKMTGMAKIESLCEWLSDKLDSTDRKFIVFGHHKDFLNGISQVLKKKKINFMKIDGSTPNEKRFDYTKQFQEDPNCRVAVLSIIAASVGLTLTAASEVVMGEFPWTPALAQQGECRAHRNGQKELVTCYYIIANNTIDGYLWNMLAKKSVVSSLMLDGGEGDEMEDEITESSGDLLDSVILAMDKLIKKNLISLDDIPENFEDFDFDLELIDDIALA